MEVCTNIGRKQRRFRALFGVVGLALGVALAAWMVATGVVWFWRAGLFVVFYGAALGHFQARGKT